MKTKCTRVVLLFLLLVLTGWLVWGNKTIGITEVTIQNGKIPASFSGYRIAQVSDLHNDCFGEGQSRLLEKTREAAPDLIVITGDLVDSKRTNLDAAMEYVKGAVEIAPVYFIAGNHEYRIAEYPELVARLMEAGVRVLENGSAEIAQGGESIRILGLAQPADRMWERIEGSLAQMDADPAAYRILLAHHPEWMYRYVEAEMDLVLAGHAHGGQIRIPFLGGVFAPEQGFFPVFDAGEFTEQSTTMIVSRGIGNSIFPVRVNNRPEIVVVTLQAGEPE